MPLASKMRHVAQAPPALVKHQHERAQNLAAAAAPAAAGRRHPVVGDRLELQMPEQLRHRRQAGA